MRFAKLQQEKRRMRGKYMLALLSLSLTLGVSASFAALHENFVAILFVERAGRPRSETSRARLYRHLPRAVAKFLLDNNEAGEVYDDGDEVDDDDYSHEYSEFLYNGKGRHDICKKTRGGACGGD